MSSQIGGVGLNLQKLGHIMIMWDRQSNVSMEAQATGRVIRRGQKNTPIIYRLIMLGTMDHTAEMLNFHKWEPQGKVLRNHPPTTWKQLAKDDPSRMDELQLFLIKHGYYPGSECPPELWDNMLCLLNERLVADTALPDDYTFATGTREIDNLYGGTTTNSRKRKRPGTPNEQNDVHDDAPNPDAGRSLTSSSDQLVDDSTDSMWNDEEDDGLNDGEDDGLNDEEDEGLNAPKTALGLSAKMISRRLKVTEALEQGPIIHGIYDNDPYNTMILNL